MNKTIDPKARERFLAALTLLSMEHGITIYGCGCCGSPSLEPLEDSGGYKTTPKGEFLQWRSVQYLLGYRAEPKAENPYWMGTPNWQEWDRGQEDREDGR